MLHTTFDRLHKAGACTSSYKRLAKSLGGISRYGEDTPIPLEKVHDVCGLGDALWCLGAVIEDADKEIRLFACDCAEQSLPLFEKEYPDDKRPRQAIETSRMFANGKATQKELAAARNAVWVARDAARAAVWAAWAAVWAARDADRDADRDAREWQKKRFLVLLG